MLSIKQIIDNTFEYRDTLESKITFNFNENKIKKDLIHNPERYKRSEKIDLEDANKLRSSGLRFTEWVRLDGSLTNYGKKNILNFIEEYNSSIIEVENSKQRRKFLKDSYNKIKNKIDTFHEKDNLKFKITDNFPGVNLKLYKSPTHNRRQSSEYRLGLINDKLAYFRKSNHWGKFTVNIYDIDKAIKKLKVSKKEAIELQEADPFGRIGTWSKFWDIKGGDTNSNKSQTGYILL